jgi:outer membrane protein assembly factor BamB
VDGPPAVAKGICLVGCNDGWVYALRADDGQQVWRFRAAPAERRIVAYGQVESRWPVVGGPVVVGDNAYVLAGRTTEADGGLYVHALEIATGKCLWSARRVKPDDGPIGAWNLRGVKDDYVGPADILDCDGKTLAISGHRTGRVNLKTGQSTSAGTYNAHRFALMVSRYASDNQKVDNPPVAYSPAGTVLVRQAADAQKKQHTYVALASGSGWKVELPEGMRVEALASSGTTVLAAVSGASGHTGELWAIGKDGGKLGSHPLPAGPVFEGLSAARGRVYVALQNGAVACFAGK